MAIAIIDLLQDIEYTGLLPEEESMLIHDIVIDSRHASPHTMFVALKGFNTDGLLFVDDAIARGASAILTDDGSGYASTSHVPVILVKDARDILGEIAARLYHHPAQNLRLHAITGTNGKTTTAYMLAGLLQKMGKKTAFWTTNEVTGIAHPFRPSMTTPEAPQLHRFLREVADAGVEDVVIEVSSHALQLGRVNGLWFDSVAFTNITPDHLDFHKTFPAYVAAKASLLTHLKPNGIAILNRDDETLAALNIPSTIRHSYVGLYTNSETSAAELTLGRNFSQWTWMQNAQNQGRIHLPVPGLHNVVNALIALAVASEFGCQPAIAQQALAEFAPPPRRLQSRSIGPYMIVSDVAMNRASYDAVMQTMQTLNRPLVVITAIRGNRGDEVNRDIANVLADWNDTLHYAPVIVTSSETYIRSLTIDHRVRKEEMQAFRDQARARNLSIRAYQELPQAIRAGCAHLPRDGGILLLLGTFGMDSGMALAESILKHRK